MEKYNKIEAIFTRDEKTKKVYPQYRNPDIVEEDINEY